MTVEEEEQLDDMTIGLQMQQFLDEWHYRVLHANMALSWDRHQCVMAAMDLFEAHGLVISEQEKQVLAVAEETHMIEVLVRKMAPELRRTFEHFTLQLQLIVSTATRVRNSLEEGEPGDVAHIVEEGDTGITQQILKQAVVEAGIEIAELREIHGGWSKNMKGRLERLSRTAETTQEGRFQLERINMELDAFRAHQNAKSQKVLRMMSAQTDEVLVKACFSGWRNLFFKTKSEKFMQDKFQAEIDGEKESSAKSEEENLKLVMKVFQKTAVFGDMAFLAEVVRSWAKCAKDGREQQELLKKVKAQEERLSGLKEAQKQTAKQSMLRIVGGQAEGLKAMVFQAWSKSLEENKKENEYAQKCSAMEGQMKAAKAKKNEESKGVLARMAGSTTTGLMYSTLAAWADETRTNKKGRELEAQIAAQQDKFVMLNGRQKGNAVNAAESVIQLEKENLMMSCFMNWVTEAKLDRLIRHYGGKMETKKQQLEAVQQMFKSFATQLGEISNTPRSQTRKSGAPRSSSSAGAAPREGQARPPAMPSHAALA